MITSIPLRLSYSDCTEAMSVYGALLTGFSLGSIFALGRPGNCRLSVNIELTEYGLLETVQYHQCSISIAENVDISSAHEARAKLVSMVDEQVRGSGPFVLSIEIDLEAEGKQAS